jgi:uncharacterized protein YkwD
MSKRERRFLPLSGFIIMVALMLSGGSKISAQESSSAATGKEYLIHLPLLSSTADPLTDEETAMQFLNYMRYHAGVPAAVDHFVLDNNCFEHARYMAENDLLTHQQNPRLPYSSAAGQVCAKRSNTWLGIQNLGKPWQPIDALHSWRTSVPHRLWMLYPTTTVFGFGFYTSDDQHAGAAIDVLSRANFDADEAYKGWPVQYPGPGQKNIPAIAYPITLNWRYFGEKPDLYQVQLTTAHGVSIPYESNTDLEAGHKGIQVLPKADLPENSVINVSISGSYEGEPFIYAWRFTTGTAMSPFPVSQPKDDEQELISPPSPR